MPGATVIPLTGSILVTFLPHRLGVFSQVVAAADIESANTPQGYFGSFSPHDGAARTPSWPEVVKAA